MEMVLEVMLIFAGGVCMVRLTRCSVPDVVQRQSIFAVLSVTLNHFLELKMILMFLFKLGCFHGRFDSDQSLICVCIFLYDLLDVFNPIANVKRYSFHLAIAYTVFTPTCERHKVLQLLHILQGWSVFLV